MGIAGGVLGVESDIFHQLEDPVAALLFCLIQFLDIQRFSDDVLHGHTGIQRRIGILKDHGRFPAELFDISFGLHGFTAIDHFARGRFVQVQDRTSRCSLTAAGLSDQTQGLSLHDVKRDVIHGLEGLCPEKPDIDRKILFQMADPDQGFAVIIFITHVSSSTLSSGKVFCRFSSGPLLSSDSSSMPRYDFH